MLRRMGWVAAPLLFLLVGGGQQFGGANGAVTATSSRRLRLQRLPRSSPLGEEPVLPPESSSAASEALRALLARTPSPSGKEEVEAQERRVTVHLCGGLGNQLAQVATLLQYAKDHNLQPYLVGHEKVQSTYGHRETYWHSVLSAMEPLLLGPSATSLVNDEERHCKVEQIVQKGCFEAPHICSSFVELQAPSSGRSAAAVHEDGGTDVLEREDHLVEGSSSSASGVESCPIELKGYFLNVKYFERALPLLSSAFWNEESAAHARARLTKLLGAAGKSKNAPVGVHMRLTDFGNLGWELRPDYYARALREAKAQRKGAELDCVLFSDDPARSREVLREVGGCARELVAEEDDVLSFFMMAQLPTMVIADSSYSFWAALLRSKAPGKLVLVPELEQPRWNYLKEPLRENWPGWVGVPASVVGDERAQEHPRKKETGLVLRRVMPIAPMQPPPVVEEPASSGGALASPAAPSPRSFFGDRPECPGSYQTRMFSPAKIQAAEKGVREWLLSEETRLERFNDEEPLVAPGADFRKDPARMAEPAHARFASALPPVGPACSELSFLDASSNHDEGKYVCGLSMLKQHPHGDDPSEQCTILSIGSNNMWAFEVAAFRETSCQIHTFDCTVKKPLVPAEIQSRTTFHKVCLGESDTHMPDGRVFKSYPTLLKDHVPGLTRPPEVLKMDIEGFEYPVMRSITQQSQEAFGGSAAAAPQQILMEVHHRTYKSLFGQDNDPGALAWAHRDRTPGELMAFMTEVYTFGYRLSHADWGTVCPHCLEVVLSRVFC